MTVRESTRPGLTRIATDGNNRHHSWRAIMRASTLRFVYVLSLLLLSSVVGYSQFSGSLQGSIEDRNAAVVPSVSVTLVNVDTGVTQQTVSTESGVYRFDSLAPGNYRVSAQAAGFSPTAVSFNLTTGQTRDIPLTMEVGHVLSSVIVTTQAPLLDTSDSRFEETLDTTALTDLPLPGRNPTSVMTITPGVTGQG